MEGAGRAAWPGEGPWSPGTLAFTYPPFPRGDPRTPVALLGGDVGRDGAQAQNKISLVKACILPWTRHVALSRLCPVSEPRLPQVFQTGL